MSTLRQNYGNSTFMIVVEIVTLVKNGVQIPTEAFPVMYEMAEKLCKKQHCSFASMEHNEGIVTFVIHADLHLGDLGKLVGVIKSHWARMLKSEFHLTEGVWLPRYLVLSDRPENREELKASWIEKVSKLFEEEGENG